MCCDWQCVRLALTRQRAPHRALVSAGFLDDCTMRVIRVSGRICLWRRKFIVQSHRCETDLTPMLVTRRCDQRAPPATTVEPALLQPTSQVACELRCCCGASSQISVAAACAAGTFNALTTQSSASACVGLCCCIVALRRLSVLRLAVCPAGTYSAAGAASCTRERWLP